MAWCFALGLCCGFMCYVVLWLDSVIYFIIDVVYIVAICSLCLVVVVIGCLFMVYGCVVAYVALLFCLLLVVLGFRLA